MISAGPEQANPLRANLVLPVIVAPMFLVSGPELVIASCRAGLMGSLPTQNARSMADLESWFEHISSALAADRAAGLKPAGWAVSVNVHNSYERFGAELDLICRFKPDVVITCLGPPSRVLDQVKSYGGRVLADVTTLSLARKAAQSGADGLVLVCSGAGGHTGTFSPFAFVHEVRRFFAGTIVLAGAISDARALRAAQILGADMVYMGTRFIAATESLVGDDYRQMLIRAGMEGVIATKAVTGVVANWLGESLAEAGYDRASLDAPGKVDFSDVHGAHKPWKNIHGAGQSVGMVDRVAPVREIVDELVADYRALLTEEAEALQLFLVGR